MIDYYEFLQISPQADSETIHRVYRFLATRLHPDNPDSGDADAFQVLKEANDVLSNPARRSEYDSARRREAGHIAPLSSSVDFMDSLEGELNRRLALLVVCYFRRRENPRAPQVSLAEIEMRMGFPRDYLDFTTWYLTKKGYVARADNSDFTLTADGVDFVETQRANIPLLNKLLTNGKGPIGAGTRSTHQHSESHKGPIVLPDSMERLSDRRVSSSDRRILPRGRRASDRPDEQLLIA
jgi:curved DNA-binding protein